MTRAAPTCIELTSNLERKLTCPYSNTLQDKRLRLSLNANRKVIGTLRGYDAFLNVVLEDVESETGQYLGQVVIRGNSIVQLEGLERV
jgi:small nuclear ribonucleoprotein G